MVEAAKLNTELLNHQDYPRSLFPIVQAINGLYPNKSLPDKFDLLVVTALGHNRPTAQFAKNLGVSTNEITRSILRSSDVEVDPMVRRIKIKAGKIRKVIKEQALNSKLSDGELLLRISAGQSYALIGDHFGLTPEQVKYRLQKLQYEDPSVQGRRKRRGSRLYEEIAPQVEALRNDPRNLSNDEIVAMLNEQGILTTTTTVNRTIRILVHNKIIKERPKLPGYIIRSSEK